MTAVVRMELGARGYDIVVGAGLLAEAGKRLGAVLRRPQVVVVSDANVAPLYLPALKASLAAEGIAAEAVTVPAGEGTKSFAQLERLAEDILERGIERSTALVALGGGVVGDLAGFAAAILLRGVDCIQVPTTLLAQVDSAIGGKTGINTGHGKNLVGSFHQPRLVLADMDTLDTLSRRQLLAGYAEVVKYGLIADAKFFAWLEAHGPSLIDGDRAARTHAVAHCCRVKADIVADDEREAGRRALLNLGHTFAHALEAETGYSEALLHGEAVAVGLCLAFDLSQRLGLCPAEDAARVRAHLDRVGLPTRPPPIDGHAWQHDRLLERITRDKKVQDGRPTFVLARGIGRAFLTQDAPPEEIEALLAAA